MEAALASAPGSSWGTIHSGSGVLDSLIHRYNQARSLRGRCKGVDAHHSWLPHKGMEVVGDVLIVDVYPVPPASLKENGGIMELLSFLLHTFQMTQLPGLWLDCTFSRKWHHKK